MSAAEMLAGAAPGRAPGWHSLEGKKVWRAVHRLQARMEKAVANSAAFREARLSRLEPYEAQASGTVLRGRGSRDASSLPDYSRVSFFRASVRRHRSVEHAIARVGRSDEWH